MRCIHLREVGWQEFICGISGASVVGDCGQERTEAGDLISMCVPRLALRLARGLIEPGNVPRGTEPGTGGSNKGRRVVFAMAREIHRQETGVDLDFSALTEEQIAEVRERAAQALKQRKAARKELPAMKRRLAVALKDKERIEELVGAYQERIEAVERGQLPLAAPDKAADDRPAGQRVSSSDAARARAKSHRDRKRREKMVALGLDPDKPEDVKRYRSEAMKAGPARRKDRQPATA